MTAEEIEKVVAAVLEKMGVMNPHPDAPLPGQDYYSIKTCAHITGVSEFHIRRAIVGGTLVSSDLGTKQVPLYRVHKDDLDKWLKDRQDGPKPPPRITKQGSSLPPSRHFPQKKKVKQSV